MHPHLTLHGTRKGQLPSDWEGISSFQINEVKKNFLIVEFISGGHSKKPVLSYLSSLNQTLTRIRASFADWKRKFTLREIIK